MFAAKLRPCVRALQRVSKIQTTFLIHRPTLEIRRTIFSDEYLGVDFYGRISSKVKLSMSDEDGFKSNMANIFDVSGLQSIFTDDIVKLIDLASDDKDFDLIKNILLECMRDDYRSGSCHKPICHFFVQCLRLSKVEQAKLFWSDEQVRKSGVLDLHSVRLNYLTLLYRTELYDDLVSAYSTFKNTNLDEATIAVAALSRIGTPAAFATATEILRQPSTSGVGHYRSSNGRIAPLYSMFAYKVGQYGLAFDVLTKASSRPGKLSTNLKILIMSEVGRLNDALLLIRSELLPPRDSKNEQNEHTSPRKAIVCLEVMKKLTNAVRDKNDAELSRELTSLCKALDGSAILSEGSLEEMIYEPIAQSKRRENVSTHRREYKDKRNMYTD